MCRPSHPGISGAQRGGDWEGSHSERGEQLQMDSCWSFPMKCLPLSGFNEQALTAMILGLYLIHILIEVRELARLIHERCREGRES